MPDAQLVVRRRIRHAETWPTDARTHGDTRDGQLRADALAHQVLHHRKGGRIHMQVQTIARDTIDGIGA